MADWSDIFQGALGLGGAYLGSRAGGDQTQTTTNAPFPEWLGQWQNFNSFANQVANRPYQSNVAHPGESSTTSPARARSTAACTADGDTVVVDANYLAALEAVVILTHRLNDAMKGNA